MNAGFHCVILAGGRGKRFWPLARRNTPKPFLPLFGKKSLLRETFERLLPLCPPERILVVAGKDHRDLIRREVPEVPERNYLLEPIPRNTAAAIALGGLEVRRRAPEAHFLVSPADHFIGDPAAFRAAIGDAVPLCGRYLVTFGVRPTAPVTQYGYIEAGDPLSGAAAHKVRRFLEKPSPERSRKLLEGKQVFWNSGIFLWSVEMILEAIRNHLPRLGSALPRLRAALEAENLAGLEDVYRELEDISIDRGVLERARNVAVLPVSFPWSDVGSWSSAGTLFPEDPDGNRSRGDLVALDSGNNTVYHPGGRTALIGIRDHVIVYSRNVLLVCPKDRCQEVKEIVEIMEKRGEGEFL